MLSIWRMSEINYHKYELAAALRVTDEDAADFLQSQFSADLDALDTGQLIYGLWLDVKGKVIADSTVLRLGNEAFLILSEHSSGEAIRAKLERHIIADDVEIESVDLSSAYTVIHAIADVMSALECELPVKGAFGESDSFYIFSGRRGFDSSIEIVCKNDAAEERLSKVLKELGACPIEPSFLHEQRIEAGIALIPQEIGPSDLPGEGALVAKGAVSLTKGCYLGQEVVARMHNVGRAQRALFKVRGIGAVPGLTADLSNSEGKVVGELRSAYAVLGAKTWFGGALLKTRYVDVGAELLLDGNLVQVEGIL